MDHRTEFLRRVPGLFGVPSADLAALARSFRLMDVLDADLCTEGDQPRALFVLAEGRCEVTRTTPGGQRFRVAELSPGCLFGHLSLLTDGVRSATVRALGPARVLELPLDEARALLKNGPLHVTSALRRALIVATARQLSAATRTTAELARSAGLCTPDPAQVTHPLPAVEEAEILLADPRW